MNIKTNSKTTTTTTSIIAILSIAMITSVISGSINMQSLQQYAKGQMDNGSKAESANEYKNISSATNNSTTSSNDTSATVVVNPPKSTTKEFWINTVHFDGMTNINAGIKCDTCMQNGPTHPAEKPPLNSTIPTGGGFRITEPNKVGAWDFRSFAFSPSQIIVNQGDKVILHFIGVQGAHHIITVDGIGTFPLNRGQIHTVSFIATSPGTINYTCHLHMPNMVGQILVLPASK